MSDKKRDDLDMPDVFVSNAREWVNDLIRRESRGPGDFDNAMRRLEARYGIPATTFFRLRHGRLKEIYVSTYVKIQAAYLAECERQTRILKQQAEIARAKGLTGPLLDEISALDSDEV